jgi:hypothetical protein
MKKQIDKSHLLDEEDARISKEISQQNFPPLTALSPTLSIRPLFRDVFDMVERGDYLILSAGATYTKYLHTDCPGVKSKTSRSEMARFARQHRIIRIDLNDMPHLIDDDEWPRYIKKKFPSCRDCQCPLKDYTNTCKDIPIVETSLPYPYFYLFHLGDARDLSEVYLKARA